MISKKIALFGIISTAFLFLLTAGFHSSYAAPITLDIHKAKNPGPGFGTQKIGTVTIDSTGNKVTISSTVTAQTKQDKVFEGWLVDAGGSNYKLSLGQYEKGHLQFTENMVNPYTYSQFIFTEEPQNDKDPNAADTYAGADLPPPFGQ
jgi:hypothetical protein